MYVQNKDDKATSIHPLKVGRFAHPENMQGILKIVNKGRARIALEFETDTQANKFVDSNLGSRNDWVVFLPTHLVTCKGVLRGVDEDITKEEIKTDLKCGEREVVDVHRIKRRIRENGLTKYVSMKAVSVTFSLSLPKHVFIYKCSFEVRTYVHPVIQCFGCLRFGHTKTQCNGRMRCLRKRRRRV
ncbi:hypothetical protein QE152_g26728 [Popillia japonica]|uniref:CCHC-type domain-containing protein n=1 Tax=Popillia japonica TaxID=7064 RepID=A0AAW1JYI6_POPJA